METILIQFAILALSSGLVTELIKWVIEKKVDQVPPKLVPLISMLTGSILAALNQAAAQGLGMPQLDLGLSPAQGAVAGAAATVAHQLKTQPLFIPHVKTAAAWLLLGLWITAGGCAAWDRVTGAGATKQFCQAVPHAIACMQAVQTKVQTTDQKLAAELGSAMLALNTAAAIQCRE